MLTLQIRRLRNTLGLSRAEFARFLGVSEATVVRWESDEASTEPRGLQAMLIRALSDALLRQPSPDVARVVRARGVSHREAVKTLLDLAG